MEKDWVWDKNSHLGLQSDRILEGKRGISAQKEGNILRVGETGLTIVANKDKVLETGTLKEQTLLVTN